MLSRSKKGGTNGSLMKDGSKETLLLSPDGKVLERKSAAAAAAASVAPSASSSASLPRQEVIRRLRLLAQPATLFGESDTQRACRLDAAALSFKPEDEHATGGQQANVLIALEREERAARAAAERARVAKGGGGGGGGGVL